MGCWPVWHSEVWLCLNGIKMALKLDYYLFYWSLLLRVIKFPVVGFCTLGVSGPCVSLCFSPFLFVSGLSVSCPWLDPQCNLPHLPLICLIATTQLWKPGRITKLLWVRQIPTFWTILFLACSSTFMDTFFVVVSHSTGGWINTCPLCTRGQCTFTIG